MLMGGDMSVASILLVALSTSVLTLKPVRNADLTAALNYQHELTNSQCATIDPKVDASFHGSGERAL